MNYNLEYYVYMNLIKLGHEVRFYGYKEMLPTFARDPSGKLRSKLLLPHT
jgi:hypothetical protein